MTVICNDPFTRANSTTSIGTEPVSSQAWVNAVGTWGIQSNHVYLPTPLSDQWQHAWVNLPGVLDCTVSADITLSPNRAYAGLRLRHENTAGVDWLSVGLWREGTDDAVQLQQTVSLAVTDLDFVHGIGMSLGGTYNLKAILVGSTCAIYIDNVLIIPATAFNSGLTTPNYGFNCYRTTTVLDDALSTYDNFLVDTDTTPPSAGGAPMPLRIAR